MQKRERRRWPAIGEDLDCIPLVAASLDCRPVLWQPAKRRGAAEIPHHDDAAAYAHPRVHSCTHKRGSNCTCG
jgi:hypothetical protein